MEKCNKCGKLFNEGDGITGANDAEELENYDWECALNAGIAVDLNGSIVAAFVQEVAA